MLLGLACSNNLLSFVIVHDLATRVSCVVIVCRSTASHVFPGFAVQMHKDYREAGNIPSYVPAKLVETCTDLLMGGLSSARTRINRVRTALGMNPWEVHDDDTESDNDNLLDFMKDLTNLAQQRAQHNANMHLTVMMLDAVQSFHDSRQAIVAGNAYILVGGQLEVGYCEGPLGRNARYDRSATSGDTRTDSDCELSCRPRFPLKQADPDLR